MHDDLVQLYQKRLKQASNKKVRPREFQEGDLVLEKDYLSNQTPRENGSLLTKARMSSRKPFIKGAIW